MSSKQSGEWDTNLNVNKFKFKKYDKSMKYSIKKQFTYIYIALMAGTILLCWFINITFLEKFYIQNREHVLFLAYETINSASSAGNITTDEFDIELQKIYGKYNLSMVIIDADSKTIKSSTNDTEMLTRQLLDHIFRSDGTDVDRMLNEKGYVLQNVVDPRTKTEYMEMWGVLDNGNLFLFRTALEGIRDSVGIANRFLAYVGVGGLLIGALVIIYVSKKVTEPILKLTDISKRMTNLDFEVKYDGSSKNEVGILGHHMNLLSETLEKTISELKTVNTELQKDIDKKTEIDNLRREFVSNVSHELKTPIALIQGYAEGLKDGISDDPESMQYYCDVIIDEAVKMNKMVKEIMTLSQLEAGVDSLVMERFDITSLIMNTLQSSEILLSQNGIQIETIHTDQPMYVWGDEFKIEEVFRNYLSNAMNHAAGKKIITISLVSIDEKVRVCVHNTGEPIPEESIQHVWEKFYKVDKARTREYGGSGVGLSIVKAILEAMNQNYGVTNMEDGVTFWFELDTK